MASHEGKMARLLSGVGNDMDTEKTLKEPPLSLSQAWEKQARRWATWARKPGHDSYWQFHRDQFFALLPEPGMLTVDEAAGKGASLAISSEWSSTTSHKVPITAV